MSAKLVNGFIIASRPKTLLISASAVLAGSALAYLFGFFQPLLLLATLFTALLIQAGINIFNDLYDFKKGADTCNRAGPTRAVQAELISPAEAFWLANGCYLLAVITAMPIALFGGPWLIFAILCSMLFGFLYTAGPYPLAYFGLGELFVIIFFGFVITESAFYVQTGFLTISSAVLSLQLGLLAAIPIIINNIRDIETDKVAHKYTLSVLCGKKFSHYEVTLFYFTAFVLAFYWWSVGLFFTALFTVAILLNSFRVTKSLIEVKQKNEYNQLLVKSAKLEFMFALFFILGAILDKMVTLPYAN